MFSLFGRTQVHRLKMVTGQSKGFIYRTDDQGRAGRVNGDRQEFGNRQAIRQTGGTVGGLVVGQARGRYQEDRQAARSRKKGSRQAGGDSTTGGWSDSEGSVTGSDGETFLESRESSEYQETIMQRLSAESGFI